MRATALMQFQLFGTLKKEDFWVIAHCPLLDISTQGRTVAEAKKNLIEAAELFIVSCLERGTLDLALRELGFSTIPGATPQPPPLALPDNAFSFPVPIPLQFHNNVVTDC